MINLLLQNKKHFILFLCFILSSINLVFSQNGDIPVSLIPDVETTVDKNEMNIGDIFHLTVTLTFDDAVRIDNPTPNIDLGQFEILDIDPGLTIDLPNSEKQQKLITFTLSTYFTGEYEIPAFDIRFHTEEGQTGLVQTAPIKINVVPLTPEEAENIDIKGLKEQADVEGKSYLNFVILLIILLLILLAVAYWLWKKYNKKQEPEQVIHRLTPQEQALQALAKLRANTELIEQKKFKEFSIEVSTIMRQYIENRWGIPAMDETSYEILSDLDKKELNVDLIQKFRDFFDNCDLMKFAKHEPQPTEMTDLIDLAEVIVRATPLPEFNINQSTTSNTEVGA